MNEPGTPGGRLQGQVAVITGAASGIGAETARLFVAEGASVALADIQTDRGERIAAGLGPRASYRHTDVTREDDIQSAIAHAVDRFGRLDCMFNNAGGGVGDSPIAVLEFEACSRLIDVFLKSVIMGMKHAAIVMRPQGAGTIINTASVAGLGIGYGGHVYSACKAAVIHLTRSVANELAEDGIRVNCIAPGAIPTAIFGRSFGLDQDQAEGLIPVLVAGLGKGVPLKRAGTTTEVAEAALWLASDRSSYVTGHCLVVDGGITTGRTWSEKTAPAQEAAPGDSA